ncbi:MAG: hypothetical protein KDA44_00775 [Planctomycetales bacterium]|nr:hypothetical protein [Planctomycetales bacterium]
MSTEYTVKPQNDIQSGSNRQQGAARRDDDLAPANDAVEYLKAYARQRPEVAALWCFGVGFILGWKLKPW